MTEQEKLDESIQFIKDLRKFVYKERHNTGVLLLYPVLNKIAYEVMIKCDNFLEHLND